MDRILASEGFLKSDRMVRFLRHLVDNALRPGPAEFKEHRLGVEVFDRGESFDPRVDSIVRVEATRLRKKLEQYYAKEGLRDSVRQVDTQSVVFAAARIK